MSRSLKLGSALVVLTLILSACAGPAATPTPAPTAPPTVAPATATPAPATATPAPATATPAPATATPAPSGSAAPTPSATPFPSPVVACAGGGSGGTLTGTLTLWHSYGSGAGTESNALNQALGVVCAENPGLTVNVVGLDFGGLFNTYKLSAPDGTPDLFIAPNDSLYDLAEAGELQDVTASLDQSQFSQLALQGSTYTTTAGVTGIWQVPESLKAVALYYNKDKVATPPATTADLLAAVQGGAKVGLLEGMYHNFGWWGAFGGQLMDANGKCIADQGGVAQAFQYMVDLKNAGVVFEKDYSKLADGFNNGTYDMIVDGPWAAGGYVQHVTHLGVAPMPAGPSGPALPLTGVDGYNINPFGSNVALATAFAIRMVQPDIQAIYANVAYHIPSNPSVPPSQNEVSAQFAQAVINGALRPQRPELGAFWDNFGNALNNILDTGANPVTEVATACQAMNTANGK